MHLHFVGIGGIGMSGIAEVFLNRGYVVSGSDLSASETTRRLEQLGAKVFVGHAAGNVRGANVVVISSAVRATNPEVVEAHRLRIPVIPRAEMLAELMRGKFGIAVAGTHGKTTTTSMLATILTVAGLDPTLVIGGKVDSLGGNAKHGEGKYVVAEADESDGSFLHLPATLAIVTNIDGDHLDHYGDMASIEKAFIEFIGKIPFYGMTAVCGEDEGVRRCLSRFTKPVLTYGFSAQWDYYADQTRSDEMGSTFKVWRREDIEKPHELMGEVRLRVPGRHNVLNALATAVVAVKLGISFDKIAEGLESFRGVRRRFEIRWESSKKKQLVVDDYGHHPTEVQATLAAARQIWKGRIITIFQPHRYSRTLHCQKEFAGAFKESDVVLISDIYAAGEDPIEGVTGQWLASKIGGASYAGDLEKAKTRLLAEIKPGDLILCLGAGSITKLAGELSKELQAMEAQDTQDTQDTKDPTNATEAGPAGQSGSGHSGRSNPSSSGRPITFAQRVT